MLSARATQARGYEAPGEIGISRRAWAGALAYSSIKIRKPNDSQRLKALALASIVNIIIPTRFGADLAVLGFGIG